MLSLLKQHVDYVVDKQIMDTLEGYIWRPSHLGQIRSICSLFESYLVEDSTYSWIIDFRTTNHACVSLYGFMKTKILHNRDFILRMGDGILMLIKATWDVYIYSNDIFLESIFLLLNLNLRWKFFSCLFIEGFLINLF